jgi:hypothetical protein
MAQPLNIESLIDQVRLSLQGTAKNATHKFWGPDGPPWGTSFDDLEELAVQIGQIVAQQVLQQSLDAQAQTPPPDGSLFCPCCGIATTPAEPEPHFTHTRAGDVTWSQPSSTCRSCRKAFFPSEQKPGH